MLKQQRSKEVSTSNWHEFKVIFLVFPSFSLKKLYQLFSDNYYETETLTELKKRRLPLYPHLGNGNMYIVRLAALPWYQELPSLMLLTS